MNSARQQVINKYHRMLNTNKVKSQDIKPVLKVANSETDHVKVLRDWLAKNRQSLKLTVELERYIKRYETDDDLLFFKDKVNAILNRKFFADATVTKKPKAITDSNIEL